MARFPFLVFFHFAIALAVWIGGVVPFSNVGDGSDSNGLVLFHHDYAPPAPPPPPPRPPSASCVDDLGGVGSFDTTCQIVSDVSLNDSVYIRGEGNFYIHSGVNFGCALAGCSIAINMSGNFTLSSNASVRSGAFELSASNANFLNGSAINTTALAGSPPSQTSGTPQGLDGAGGGHGGRGACCIVDSSKLPQDVWGGDAYSWSSLQSPYSYGSRGGSTSKEVEYGGLGGGRVKMNVENYIVLDGDVSANGGDGGNKGGGGSGGSIYIKAYKMTGSGRISACGGDGFGGGGGGRVSVDVFSRHGDPQIFVHGGQSRGCVNNAGAAGTLYDAVPRSLIVSNHNRTTDTETLLLDFPYQPLWTNVYIRNDARATVPLLWSRVQVQGQISLLSGGVLSFGLAHYASSEFELLAEELLMSDSVIKVYGALRMTVKMFLMWNSRMSIEGGDDASVTTSVLEASNLVVLKESSSIHSNANLGVRGQGLLNLSGPGDVIEAQLENYFVVKTQVGPGSALRGPLENSTNVAVIPRLRCENSDCPFELMHPPEDCNVNSSLSFTLQICRVEDISVSGLVKGSVVHFHRTRTISVPSLGIISASGMGCVGGVGRGNVLNHGIGSGGGHGGKGGRGCYDGHCIDGGLSYGDTDMPCEIGSGNGYASAGGGIIVMGSFDHPLLSLSVKGSVVADGDGSQYNVKPIKFYGVNGTSIGFGGGSGGTILLFLQTLNIAETATLSSTGGNGSPSGGGGGGGGRVHFHWSDIPTGDVYQPIAVVEGIIRTSGGLSRHDSGNGENGTISGRSCPKGLYGTFCEECPVGTFKNVTGSKFSLCLSCPSFEIPHRAVYVNVRGGITDLPCPYKCISDRFHMPHCYTALEELIYTFGGPWLFCFILFGLLFLLALVLSVARMKFVGVDDSSGPAPTQHGSQIDHSFPFLESLNEVLETNRAEESQNHVHRMYFVGPNTFSAPWHLSHTPPEQIKEIVFESAFNRFVDEINALAAYQWWEGSAYSILCVVAYPLAWSWQQWRRKIKLQRLREFVRSEYDHSCLRSCRSRALYEGLKVAATSDLMLAYVDFFLGGDEKRSDLPLRLPQRLPISIIFGGDGSYMAPFSVQNDNILTSLMSQSVPPTTWYRMVAGLNAHLRLVQRGRLKSTFKCVIKWIETHANPALQVHGVRVALASFPATSSSYCQYGLLVFPSGDNDSQSNTAKDMRQVREKEQSSEQNSPSKRRKSHGCVLNSETALTIKEKRDPFFVLSFIVHNTKPVGLQDVVGLVISIVLLGDFSLALLTFVQLYSISLVDVILVLCILPFGILLPFPAGINALFSHGPRRSSALTRVYALWNINSLVNVGVAFVCGYANYMHQSSSSRRLPFQPWNISMDESEWWIFPSGLVLCKILQSQLLNWHVANLELQDPSLYTPHFDLFWHS